MLDFLKGAANLLAGPMSAVVDGAGSALGLPPLITNAVKVGAGVATGNVMLAASGAMGVAKDLSENPPGKTEYRPSSGTSPGGSAKAGEGYAASSTSTSSTSAAAGKASSAILAPGASPLDPKLLDYADALKVLEANFDQLDMVDGKKNGSLSKKDLERISTDASLSSPLRKAAGFMLENQGLFERLDGRGPLPSFFGPATRLNDNDRFSAANLRSELARVEGDFAKYGRPERPGCGTGAGPTTPAPGPSAPPDCGTPTPTPPPRPGPTTDCGPPSPTTPTTPATPVPGPSKGPLDPAFREYRDALAVLNTNWDTFDSAVGARDNVMTRENLAAILNNPAASSTLKTAAQFFKDHPEYFDRLEMASGVGGRDGNVGRPDVTAALRQADSVLGSSGTQPSTGGGRPGGSSGASVRNIIDNPNMSVEDKIQAVLMSITEDTDAQVLDVMREMDSARGEKATLGNSDGDKKKAAKLDTSLQELELRLQKLMEKRKSMFDLMSNMSSKFNEMAKTAISNLRSA
ncbi:hypothetical protein [Pyxidicoccus xibeiensis]|uniref:hypothetical protein n=1 Tax=Pyxidicoccus xibeiensis TaxID=2906759 RepID=UPI0020A75F83|nr:hypothetical protein [Pyxidicoccus xibeiensis]MCP3142724.1 hypothetical protein [Pyxidicoccus xibeiensis]